MKAILDTNLLVAEALSHHDYEIAVSSLSWAELGYGVREIFFIRRANASFNFLRNKILDAIRLDRFLQGGHFARDACCLSADRC